MEIVINKGHEYPVETLRKYAQAHGLQLDFSGRGLYNENEPSEYLTIGDMQFVWTNHTMQPIYKRVE